jgi:hypothetical protein
VRPPERIANASHIPVTADTLLVGLVPNQIHISAPQIDIYFLHATVYLKMVPSEQNML